MTRLQLEHLIRAAAALSNDPEIVVIGSQCVLGQFPSAPEELLVSMEAVVYARNRPELSDLIDGSIGEGSPFQRTFGYFAHGIGPETEVLPGGWEGRLVLVENVNKAGARGWCLEVHDLAISKLVAGREKDLEFVSVLARHGMIDRTVLKERLVLTAIGFELREVLNGRIQRLCC